MPQVGSQAGRSVERFGVWVVYNSGKQSWLKDTYNALGHYNEECVVFFKREADAARRLTDFVCGSSSSTVRTAEVRKVALPTGHASNPMIDNVR